MLKGVKENCSSVSFSEFFAVGVENKQPCLTDQLILNCFPVLRKKKKKNAKKIKIQVGMQKMSLGTDQSERDS